MRYCKGIHAREASFCRVSKTALEHSQLLLVSHSGLHLVQPHFGSSQSGLIRGVASLQGGIGLKYRGGLISGGQD